MSADAPLARIASVAEGLKKSTSQNAWGAIHLEIPVDDDRMVVVALDGRYPVDFVAMQAFKAVPGVNQVRPAAA